ncbi:SMP-30/gluconolactonase/LRE family protein [Sphingomonas parva]|uniref:SMP-30/gluconolactonase/LRE family protein n=1 Tax=Sphingomonas parva TaxID=2555898 RepID=A0A4Y8ZXA9_9SPHN|nr:SMP-30/gluconolactonase/LRE family protein [Sphingomonas parva]TFI59146.1 SMP-30/gluconolactonase/LRE family protein [Sphingomonas parva]
MKRLRIAAACGLMGAALAAGGCMSVDPIRYETVGRIDGATPALAALIAPDAPIEKLAEGFRWSEGPVWIRDGAYLLLSDVPGNKMYRWSEEDGLSVFLDPSGYDGQDPAAFREPGSNGLIPGPGNTILMADHGNRAVARLDLATKTKTFLATRFEGKRFNSPNDLVRASNGAIYFTDPPYGLEGLNESPLKEQAWNGVYRLDPDGRVALVERGLSFPNGVILSPDERTLYVSNSDPARAVVMAFPRREDGSLGEGRVFADMTDLAQSGMPGLPDGMAIDRNGNLFATGPGGVHVFTPEGQRLGRIDTGTAIANCAFGEDGRTLFLASNNYLARIRMRTIGLGY